MTASIAPKGMPLNPPTKRPAPADPHCSSEAHSISLVEVELSAVKRTITGFRRDDAGDWVAELSCWHSQHVRHDPPFRTAPWVLDDLGRAERVGAALDCPLCDRAELPEALRVVRTAGVWDERTMPAGLRRAHRLGDGVWGRLRMQHGRLRFRARTEPALDLVIGAGGTQAIPPGVEHDVEPQGSVGFSLEFLQR